MIGYSIHYDNCKVVQYAGKHLTGFNNQLDSKGFGGWYVEQINQFVVNPEI